MYSDYFLKRRFMTFLCRISCRRLQLAAMQCNFIWSDNVMLINKVLGEVRL